MIKFKDFIPPLFVKILKKNFIKEKLQYGFLGNYNSWEEAKKNCTGYDSDIIIEKVKNAAFKVKNGEAVYERDSVLFDKIQYSYPLLTGLMWVAAQNGGNLNALDFGGALGSTYFQNKHFLNSLNCVQWNIVEQEKFVETGKLYFEDEHLKFYHSISECINKNNIDIIILSGVIQYLETPEIFLKEVISYGFKFIIIDRTLFNNVHSDTLTIQKVSPEIFDASYPCWFLDKNKFKEIFKEKYDLILEFDGFCEGKGFIFKKKDERI
ncbi:MAG TPA: methyltransferase, TIGR04325 family [Bacteroidales bacterium]|nr:methyltransferase, TIGR04325 family [Bacteroidales bacterium]HPS15969.1 methyltransferase, TIGR04325 family [Bacteroidales bacterium]